MMNKGLPTFVTVVLVGACVCHAADTPVPAREAEVKTSTAATPGTAPVFAERTPRYRIGRGDVIEITFPRVIEFTQTVTVHPDGFITLKGLEEGSELYVVDKSVPELKEMLRTTYSKILHDPLINLELKDFEKPYFTAFGEISKPGKYDLRGETTVMQALSLSGGFRDGAKTSEVLLLHRVSSELTEVKKVDIRKMLKTGDLKEDPHIQPGDIIFVSKSLMGKLDKFIPNSSVGAMMKPY
jgi:polysaccharide export outer membrane protein